MKPVEYDVYLCCRDAEERGMTSEVAAGLTRLGFRVFVAGQEAGAASAPGHFEIIGSTPDFVLISAPALPGPAGSGADSRAAELAHAYKTRRNIVVLADPAHADPLAEARHPGRAKLASWQRVSYDRARPRESIALVAHRLLSSSDVDDRRLMRMVKRAFVALGVVLAIAVASRAIPVAVRWWNRPTAPPPLPRFTLYWTGLGQRMTNGQWAGFPLGDGSAVVAGDRIRLAFGTGSDGYAYVVARDTEGGISMLYPGVTLRGASRVRAGTVYEAPGDGRWFAVDSRAGLAAIYVVAGHEPLENLEELLDEADAGGHPAARLELLASTLSGLLDGKHATAVGPVRTRLGREVVGGLPPAPPPRGWPAAPAGAPNATGRPASQTGVVSVMVEIRLRGGQAP